MSQLIQIAPGMFVVPEEVSAVVPLTGSLSISIMMKNSGIQTLTSCTDPEKGAEDIARCINDAITQNRGNHHD